MELRVVIEPIPEALTDLDPLAWMSGYVRQTLASAGIEVRECHPTVIRHETTKRGKTPPAPDTPPPAQAPKVERAAAPVDRDALTARIDKRREDRQAPRPPRRTKKPAQRTEPRFEKPDDFGSFEAKPRNHDQLRDQAGDGL